MAPAIMSHPDLRHPFARSSLGDDTVVLYDNRVTHLQRDQTEAGFWVTPADLTRINGFVLKPEGACLGDLCIPIRAGSDLLRLEAGEPRINLTALADLLGQAWVVDEPTHTWSFGEIPVKRQSMMADAQAPDFELVDREGKVIRMSDYKGRKALIVTWSSW
jgi:hypothetical protein